MRQPERRGCAQRRRQRPRRRLPRRFQQRGLPRPLQPRLLLWRRPQRRLQHRPLLFHHLLHQRLRSQFLPRRSPSRLRHPPPRRLQRSLRHQARQRQLGQRTNRRGRLLQANRFDRPQLRAPRPPPVRSDPADLSHGPEDKASPAHRVPQPQHPVPREHDRADNSRGRCPREIVVRYRPGTADLCQIPRQETGRVGRAQASRCGHSNKGKVGALIPLDR